MCLLVGELALVFGCIVPVLRLMSGFEAHAGGDFLLRLAGDCLRMCSMFVDFLTEQVRRQGVVCGRWEMLLWVAGVRR